MCRTRPSRVTRLSAAALIAGAATFAVAAPAMAHDELIGTELVADTADGSLDSIRLSFSNSIIETGIEMVVTGPDGADVVDGAPSIAGPDVTQPLIDDLPAGTYDAAWRVVSSDGHPIEGAFTFSVAADGSADTAQIAAAEEGAEEDHAEGEAAYHEHAEDEAADHEHTEGEEHADGASDAGSEEGMPVGAVIAISVAAVAAAGAAATSVIVGQRRRKQAMGGQASPEPTNDSTPEAPSAPNGEDQR